MRVQSNSTRPIAALIVTAVVFFFVLANVAYPVLRYPTDYENALALFILSLIPWLGLFAIRATTNMRLAIILTICWIPVLIVALIFSQGAFEQMHSKVTINSTVRTIEMRNYRISEIDIDSGATGVSHMLRQERPLPFGLLLVRFLGGLGDFPNARIEVTAQNQITVFLPGSPFVFDLKPWVYW